MRIEPNLELTQGQCGADRIRRLYVTDLDGTLLNADASLSARSVCILKELLEEGLALTAATARTYYSVIPMLKELPIALPLILQNGALLYDMAQRKILHAETIAPDAFRTVCAAMRVHHVYGFVYCAEKGKLRCCYETIATDSMRQFYMERRNRYEKPFAQMEDLSALACCNPVYVTMNAPKEVLEPLVEQLRGEKKLTLSYYRDVYREGIWYLEISADTANKQHGIEMLRAMYGFEEAVGFGDNANDLPLFAACERKIAVANAADILKEQADVIIGRNTEDAVAEYLQQEWRTLSWKKSI